MDGRLREIRQRRALAIKDLAARSGVTVSTISRIETGKQRARHVTIRKLAAALGVEPEALTEGTAEGV
jgi:transcriptional regulator with XRE-family HTH domain